MNDELIYQIFVIVGICVLTLVIIYLIAEIIIAIKDHKKSKVELKKVVVKEVTQELNTGESNANNNQVVIQEPVIKEVIKEVVVDNKKNELSFEEEYKALDEKSLKYFEEVTSYARSKSSSKLVRSARYLQYNVVGFPILRITIEYGTVVASFMFTNKAFTNYVKSTKIKLKPGLTSLRLLSDFDVKVAKELIDLSLNTKGE